MPPDICKLLALTSLLCCCLFWCFAVQPAGPSVTSIFVLTTHTGHWSGSRGNKTVTPTLLTQQLRLLLVVATL
jgi:hypothetical protein